MVLLEIDWEEKHFCPPVPVKRRQCDREAARTKTKALKPKQLNRSLFIIHFNIYPSVYFWLCHVKISVLKTLHTSSA